MERKKIVIGTRGSALALKQSEIVLNKLKSARPKLEVTIKIIKTEGDINQNPIPSDVMGKGWFTKEIEKELLAGSIDMAVHSLKDLPEKLPPGLSIASYPGREDSRDALVTKDSLSFRDLKKGAVIGTDSPRRRVQLLALRNDLEVRSIRGNVPTRLEKMQTEGYDAVVLAAAGLKRLGLESRVIHYFEAEEMVSAPGQGILAIEVRTDDEDIVALAHSINDAHAEQAAKAERAFSSEIGGGCKQPVGAFFSTDGSDFTLQAVLATDNGSKVIRDSISGKTSQSIELSIELAKRMAEELARKDGEN